MWKCTYFVPTLLARATALLNNHPSGLLLLLLLTCPTSWCAPRPLFCRMLYSDAPVARTSFLAMGCWGGRRNGAFMSAIRSLVGVRVGRAYQNLAQVLVGDVG